MSTYLKAIIAIVIASIFWGSAGIVGKVLLTRFSPFEIALLRSCVASIFIFPLFMRQKRYPITKIIKEIVPITILNVINITVFYIGLQRTTVNASAIMYAATPLIVALIAVRTIHEQITTKKLIGIIIGFIGVTSIILLPNIGKGDIGFGTPIGNFLTLIAVTGWSSYIVGSRYLINVKKYSPVFIVSIFLFTSVILLFILNLITPHHSQISILTNTFIIGNLLYLGLFVTVVPQLLFQWAIQNTPSATASLTNYLQPVFAFYFAWIFLGERLTATFLLGSLLVLLGVFIATSGKATEYIRLFREKRQKK